VKSKKSSWKRRKTGRMARREFSRRLDSFFRSAFTINNERNGDTVDDETRGGGREVVKPRGL
jgi:hypothetical protein